MKKLLLLILIIFCINSQGQKIDEKGLEKIGNQLVLEELEDTGEPFKKDDHCIRGEDGWFLSCFTAESNLGWVSDINGDGNSDAVFMVMDEGLGGGGNAFGYDFRVVFLDKDLNILSEESIFGGGKFSYGHLSIDAVKNEKIHATYEENPMGNLDYEPGDELKKINLVFFYKDGRIQEENYIKCPLYEMKKQIFKENNELVVRRFQSMDDEFNLQTREEVEISDKNSIVAILSGCEDLEIYFSRTIPFNSDLNSKKEKARQFFLENLEFLRDYTLFKSVMENGIQQFKTLDNKFIQEDEYGGFSVELFLANKWQMNIFVSGSQEQGNYLTIRLDLPSNENQMDFWESMERKERL